MSLRRPTARCQLPLSTWQRTISESFMVLAGVLLFQPSYTGSEHLLDMSWRAQQYVNASPPHQRSTQHRHKGFETRLEPLVCVFLLSFYFIFKYWPFFRLSATYTYSTTHSTSRKTRKIWFYCGVSTKSLPTMTMSNLNCNAYNLWVKYTRFRILVIGQANACKMTFL